MVHNRAKTERWWQERWQRQDRASDKVTSLGPDASDEEIIAATAYYLLTHSSTRHPYRWHLSILDMQPDRAVAFDWKRKNVRGITTTDENRARAWITECMQKGYGVFVQPGRNAWAIGMNTVAETRECMRRGVA